MIIPTNTSRLLLCLSIVASPVMAQSPDDIYTPTGIAISQAPVAATGICFGADATETISCAQADCMAQTGLEAIDCPVTDWCSPTGWTIDVFVQYAQGPHGHEYSCGWPTRKQAEQAAKIICQPDYILGCIPVLLWTPQGEKIEIF